LSSAKLPCVAKWALKLALELLPATPQIARKALERLRSNTRDDFGNAGDTQSRIIAASLKKSAASRYILHSGSNAVPSLWAKSMVATRPMLSCRIESSIAAVGEALASPTPTPGTPSAFASQKTNDAVISKKSCPKFDTKVNSGHASDRPNLQARLSKLAGPQLSLRKLVGSPALQLVPLSAINLCKVIKDNAGRNPTTTMGMRLIISRFRLSHINLIPVRKSDSLRCGYKRLLLILKIVFSYTLGIPSGKECPQ
jgi:hypothetical protein